MKNNLFVKLVIFSVVKGQLLIFLEKNNLLFGQVQKDKSLDELAKDIFKKKIGADIGKNYLEQLYTFSNSKDETINIEVAYFALITSYLTRKDNLESFASAFSIKKDSRDYEIVSYAVKRLQWKIEYTNVVYSLLSDDFTFSQLQKTYEAILGKSLDKRNFRKKILSLNIIKRTGRKKNLGKARPAEMFSFKKKSLTFVEIL
jgi:8-oxo-dGTP diphosphatase